MQIIPRQQPTHLAEVRTQLLPRVARPGGLPGYDLVPGQLSVGLVVDSPGGVHTVDERDLSRWSASQESLAAQALDNLRQRSSTDNWYSLRAVPGMLVYLAGDGHAAARLLLLKELLNPWPLGGVLVSVPTPDQLLVVPLDDLEHLSTVQVLVQSGQLAHSLGREPVTDQLFWFDGEKFAHMVVNHSEDAVEVLPPPGFLAMVEKLASLGMTAQPGEA